MGIYYGLTIATTGNINYVDINQVLQFPSNSDIVCGPRLVWMSFDRVQA